MRILICGFLCFHYAFSTPQISPSDDVNYFDYSDPLSISGNIPDYEQDHRETPEMDVPLQNSYETGQNEDDRSEVFQNRRKGSYGMEEDGEIEGTNKNYRLTMRQTYKIKKPATHNVSRIVRTKVLRTGPVVKKTYRTRYGHKNPEDGLFTTYFSGGDYNVTEDSPLFPNAAAVVVDHKIKPDKTNYNDENLKNANLKNEISEEMRSQIEPNYNTLEPRKQDDQLRPGQDILPNPYSYVYPMGYNPDPDILNYKYKTEYEQVFNPKFRPELLNTNKYEQSGIRVTENKYPENYGYQVYQDVHTITNNKDKGNEKESQDPKFLGTENKNILDVRSSAYSPNLSEFDHRLLKSNIKNESAPVLESQIYTITYPMGGKYAQSTELNNNEEVIIFEDHTRSTIPPPSETMSSDIMSIKMDMPVQREIDDVKVMAIDKLPLETKLEFTTPYGKSEGDDIVSTRTNIPKLRENSPKVSTELDSIISQPFGNVNNTFQVVENINEKRSEVQETDLTVFDQLSQEYQIIGRLKVNQKLVGHKLLSGDQTDTFIMGNVGEKSSEDKTNTGLLENLDKKDEQSTARALRVHEIASGSHNILGKINGSTVYEIYSGLDKIVDEIDDKPKMTYLGAGEALEVNENPNLASQKVTELRTHHGKKIDRVPILKLEKVYEINTGTEDTMDGINENQIFENISVIRPAPGALDVDNNPNLALQKVSEILFDPVETLNIKDENTKKLTSDSGKTFDKPYKGRILTLQRVYEDRSDSDENSDTIDDSSSEELEQISELHLSTSESDKEKWKELLEVSDEITSLHDKKVAKDKNLHGVYEVVGESPIPSNVMPQIENLEQLLENVYDIPLTPSVSDEITSGIAIVEVNENPGQSEEIDLKRSLRIDENTPDVLIETKDRRHKYHLDPDYRTKIIDLTSWLLPIDDNIPEAERDIKYFPYPHYLTHLMKHQPGDESLEKSIDIFPIDPNDYVSVNANDGLSYPELDAFRDEQLRYTPVNSPSQQYSVTDNFDFQIDNDDDQDELAELCQLARHNLKKLRKLVNRNYGLNTKTAEENDLITIVYIMGLLTEAKETDVPVENVVDDLLFNLRRLGELRKLLCNDFDETDQVDLNDDKNYENIEDMDFDINILARFDHYLSPTELPSYHKSPKTSLEHYPAITKNYWYPKRPTKEKSKVKKIHVVKPNADHVKNIKQTVYKNKPYSIEYTKQNVYVTKPEGVVTATQDLYLSDDMKTSNPNLYRPYSLPYKNWHHMRLKPFKTTHQNLYTNQPYFTEYLDHKNPYSHYNVYPIRTDNVKNGEQGVYDVESGVHEVIPLPQNVDSEPLVDLVHHGADLVPNGDVSVPNVDLVSHSVALVQQDDVQVPHVLDLVPSIDVPVAQVDHGVVPVQHSDVPVPYVDSVPRNVDLVSHGDVVVANVDKFPHGVVTVPQDIVPVTHVDLAPNVVSVSNVDLTPHKVELVPQHDVPTPNVVNLVPNDLVPAPHGVVPVSQGDVLVPNVDSAPQGFDLESHSVAIVHHGDVPAPNSTDIVPQREVPIPHYIAPVPYDTVPVSHGYNVKPEYYDIEPEYQDFDNENMYTNLPHYSDDIAQKLYPTAPSFVVYEKQNVFPDTRVNVGNFNGGLYTQQPVYTKTIDQNQYPSNQINQNMDKVKSSIYNPEQDDYIDKLSHYINPVRPVNIENVNQHFYNTKVEYPKNTDMFTKRPDYTNNAVQNFYTTRPDYAINTEKNIYPNIAASIGSTNMKWSTIKPEDTPRYKDKNFSDSMEFLDEYLFAIKQNKYPLNQDDLEKANKKWHWLKWNKNAYTQPDMKENVYINQPAYTGAVNQNVYPKKSENIYERENYKKLKKSPKKSENIYQNANYHNLYPKKTDHTKSTYQNENSDTYSPDYIDKLAQYMYPSKTDYVEYKHRNIYKNEPEYVEKTNEYLYTKQPDYTDNMDQKINSVNQYRYPVRPGYEEKTDQYLYTSKPDYVKYTKESVYGNQPAYTESIHHNLYPKKIGKDFKSENYQNLYPKISENIYQSEHYQNLYPLSEFTNQNEDYQNLYPMKTESPKNYYQNKNLDTNQQDYIDSLAQYIYPANTDYVEYKNLNVHTIEPGYIKKTNEYLYTNPPDYTDQKVYSVNQYKYTHSPGYVEKTNKNVYNNQPGYTKYINQNMYPIKPPLVERTNQNMFAKHLENTNDNMIGEILEKMYLRENSQYYPTKSVEREHGSDLHIDYIEIDDNDLQQDSDIKRPELPFTEDDAQKSNPTSPLDSLTTPQKDFNDVTSGLSVDLLTIISTTQLPYKTKDSNIHNEYMTNRNTPQVLDVKVGSANVASTVKPKVTYDENSGEDYKELLAELKQYHLDDDQTKPNALIPKIITNDSAFNANAWGHVRPKLTSNYNRDWTKQIFDKSLKKPDHFNVYLNDKKLSFWTDNPFQAISQNVAPHNVRIEGYLQKIDLETLVTIAHYRSVNYDSDIVPTKELSLLLEARDKIDISIVTNVIWHEILRLRMLGASEEKIGQFVHKLVTTALPHVFRDSQNCRTKLLKHLLNSIKHLEFYSI